MTRPRFPPRTHRVRDLLAVFSRQHPDLWRAVDAGELPATIRRVKDEEE